MNKGEDSKIRNFRSKLKRELLTQMKDSFGTHKTFEIEKIIHHHISKLKMVQLTKIKSIQSTIEAKIKNKLKLRKRRKSSIKNPIKTKRVTKRKLEDWKKGPSQDGRVSGNGHPSLEADSFGKHYIQNVQWESPSLTEKMRGDEERQTWVDTHYHNGESEGYEDGHSQMRNSKNEFNRKSRKIERRRDEKKDSLLKTLPEDNQSNMISNLSKLTEKNILNQLSQSKELFTVERKNKGSTVTRETKIKKFGVEKKMFNSRNQPHKSVGKSNSNMVDNFNSKESSLDFKFFQQRKRLRAPQKRPVSNQSIDLPILKKPAKINRLSHAGKIPGDMRSIRNRFKRQKHSQKKLLTPDRPSKQSIDMHSKVHLSQNIMTNTVSSRAGRSDFVEKRVVSSRGIDTQNNSMHLDPLYNPSLYDESGHVRLNYHGQPVNDSFNKKRSTCDSKLGVKVIPEKSKYFQEFIEFKKSERHSTLESGINLNTKSDFSANVHVQSGTTPDINIKIESISELDPVLKFNDWLKVQEFEDCYKTQSEISLGSNMSVESLNSREMSETFIKENSGLECSLIEREIDGIRSNSKSFEGSEDETNGVHVGNGLSRFAKKACDVNVDVGEKEYVEEEDGSVDDYGNVEEYYHMEQKDYSCESNEQENWSKSRTDHKNQVNNKPKKSKDKSLKIKKSWIGNSEKRSEAFTQQTPKNELQPSIDAFTQNESWSKSRKKRKIRSRYSLTVNTESSNDNVQVSRNNNEERNEERSRLFKKNPPTESINLKASERSLYSDCREDESRYSSRRSRRSDYERSDSRLDSERYKENEGAISRGQSRSYRESYNEDYTRRSRSYYEYGDEGSRCYQEEEGGREDEEYDNYGFGSKQTRSYEMRRSESERPKTNNISIQEKESSEHDNSLDSERSREKDPSYEQSKESQKSFEKSLKNRKKSIVIPHIKEPEVFDINTPRRESDIVAFISVNDDLNYSQDSESVTSNVNWVIQKGRFVRSEQVSMEKQRRKSKIHKRFQIFKCDPSSDKNVEFKHIHSRPHKNSDKMLTNCNIIESEEYKSEKSNKSDLKNIKKKNTESQEAAEQVNVFKVNMETRELPQKSEASGKSLEESNYDTNYMLLKETQPIQDITQIIKCESFERLQESLEMAGTSSSKEQEKSQLSQSEEFQSKMKDLEDYIKSEMARTEELHLELKVDEQSDHVKTSRQENVSKGTSYNSFALDADGMEISSSDGLSERICQKQEKMEENNEMIKEIMNTLKQDLKNLERKCVGPDEDEYQVNLEEEVKSEQDWNQINPFLQPKEKEEKVEGKTEDVMGNELIQEQKKHVLDDGLNTLNEDAIEEVDTVYSEDFVSEKSSIERKPKSKVRMSYLNRKLKRLQKLECRRIRKLKEKRKINKKRRQKMFNKSNSKNEENLDSCREEIDFQISKVHPKIESLINNNDFETIKEEIIKNKETNKIENDTKTFKNKKQLNLKKSCNSEEDMLMNKVSESAPIHLLPKKDSEKELTEFEEPSWLQAKSTDIFDFPLDDDNLRLIFKLNKESLFLLRSGNFDQISKQVDFVKKLRESLKDKRQLEDLVRMSIKEVKGIWGRVSNQEKLVEPNVFLDDQEEKVRELALNRRLQTGEQSIGDSFNDGSDEEYGEGYQSPNECDFIKKMGSEEEEIGNEEGELNEEFLNGFKENEDDARVFNHDDSGTHMVDVVENRNYYDYDIRHEDNDFEKDYREEVKTSFNKGETDVYENFYDSKEFKKSKELLNLGDFKKSDKFKDLNELSDLSELNKFNNSNKIKKSKHFITEANPKSVKQSKESIKKSIINESLNKLTEENIIYNSNQNLFKKPSLKFKTYEKRKEDDFYKELEQRSSVQNPQNFYDFSYEYRVGNSSLDNSDGFDPRRSPSPRKSEPKLIFDTFQKRSPDKHPLNHIIKEKPSYDTFQSKNDQVQPKKEFNYNDINIKKNLSILKNKSKQRFKKKQKKQKIEMEQTLRMEQLKELMQDIPTEEPLMTPSPPFEKEETIISQDSFEINELCTQTLKDPLMNTLASEIKRDLDLKRINKKKVKKEKMNPIQESAEIEIPLVARVKPPILRSSANSYKMTVEKNKIKTKERMPKRRYRELFFDAESRESQSRKSEKSRNTSKGSKRIKRKKTKSEILREEFIKKKYGNHIKRLQPPERKKKSNIPRVRKRKASTSSKQTNVTRKEKPKTFSYRQINTNRKQSRNSSESKKNSNVNSMRRNHYDLMRNIYGKKVTKKKAKEFKISKDLKDLPEAKKIKNLIQELL